MEKQKFFLIFIVAGALVIFLQQDSLQLTGRHWNKSASTFEHDENIFSMLLVFTFGYIIIILFLNRCTQKS